MRVRDLSEPAVDAGLAPSGPVRSALPRVGGSLRRTSTIDATWPDGAGSATYLDGRARDLLTRQGGTAQIVGVERMAAVVGFDGRIQSVESRPARPQLAGLQGAPSGRGYRSRLAEVAPGEVAAATLLHLLLDDLPGAALVSGFAPSRWHDSATLAALGRRPGSRVVRGICTGFQDGSSALTPAGTSVQAYRTWRVAPIDALGDVLAWHRLAEPSGMTMRRARRTDVSVDGDTIHVDAFFQDSCTVRAGGRQAVHEYTLTATADLKTRSLLSLAPVPRVLPHRECPLAIANAEGLIGLPLAELRPRVLKQLRATAGCTHLNDMIRSLADVPSLVDVLIGSSHAGAGQSSRFSSN